MEKKRELFGMNRGKKNGKPGREAPELLAQTHPDTGKTHGSAFTPRS